MKMTINTDSDRRSNRRVVCITDYFCSIMTGNLKFECKLKNIAYTGACIITNVPLKINDMIILHLVRGKDYVFRCKVAWVKENHYGVSILLETSEDFENISYIINNHIQG